MLGINFCRQLVNGVFVGYVSNHDGRPPVVHDGLGNDTKTIRIVDHFLRGCPLKIGSYGMIRMKITGTCETFWIVVVESTPQHAAGGVSDLFFSFICSLVILPSTVDAVLLNFFQNRIWCFPDDIWRPSTLNSCNQTLWSLLFWLLWNGPGHRFLLFVDTLWWFAG